MNAYMSNPGNTAKLGATLSNIQRAQSSPSLEGSKHITLLSQRISTLCQPGIGEDLKNL